MSTWTRALSNWTRAPSNWTRALSNWTRAPSNWTRALSNWTRLRPTGRGLRPTGRGSVQLDAGPSNDPPCEDPCTPSNASARPRVIVLTMQPSPYQSQPPGWIDGRTVEGAYREQAMFRSVFGWMFVGLLLTAASSLLVILSPAMQELIYGNRFTVWILFIAELGLVMNLSWRLQKLSPAAAAGSFLLFSLLNGLTPSG